MKAQPVADKPRKMKTSASLERAGGWLRGFICLLALPARIGSNAGREVTQRRVTSATQTSLCRSLIEKMNFPAAIAKLARNDGRARSSNRTSNRGRPPDIGSYQKDA